MFLLKSVFLFLLCLISPSLLAGDERIKMVSKYDYAAVCDFSPARFYLFEKQINSMSEKHAETNKRYEFKDDGVEAKYLFGNQGFEIFELNIEAKQLMELERNKQHLLNRLGVDYVSDPIVMVGCDDIRLVFYFKSEVLLRVRLDNFFND